MHTLTDQEFSGFQRFIFEAAGITLSDAKKALVSGRLSKRLPPCQLSCFGDYLRLLQSGQQPDEVQTAVDLLTTNETYFFREPKHFELLRRLALDRARTPRGRGHGQSFRVWSAACASGEEAYTMAMVLANALGEQPWQVVGSDISARVLAQARTGHYPLARTRHIAPAYLKRFCLKGEGEQAGTLLVQRHLRERVQFLQVNLNTELPRLAPFDVVFLRNVLIYFSADTKRQVVRRVLSMLKPGGHFCIGHSESLHEVSNEVRTLMPSIYRKAEALA